MADERLGHEGEERAVVGVDGEVLVAGPGVRGAIVEQERGGRGDAGGAEIARVRPAQRRHVRPRRPPVLRIERQLAAKGERARVGGIDRQGPGDLVAGGGGVVAIDDGDPREAHVRVGVVGVELEHVAKAGLRVRRVVLLEQHGAPFEVGGRGAGIGAHGVAQDVVRVLPVAVEADRGSDREQVGGPGPVDAPAVPVRVARVDERRQRRALAGGLVFAHEGVAQREVVGVRGGGPFETPACLRVQAEGRLRRRGVEDGGEIVGRPRETRVGEAPGILETAGAERPGRVVLRRGTRRRRQGGQRSDADQGRASLHSP